MTPAARWAAAAEIMDHVTQGEPAEKALTNWARRSRFAGSKDRAAVRDHVFDILRCWRSVAAVGGGSDGRQLVLGRLRQLGVDPDSIFTGDGYAMPPLSDMERAAGSEPAGAEAWDMPDWLYDLVFKDLGDEAHAYAKALRHRASVFLRVNTAKTDRDAAQRALADAGIDTAVHPLSQTALEVLDGARRVAQSAPYLDGRVELQDVASQAVIDALDITPDMRVLDFCAGGGGKTLAMAARLNTVVEAHDTDPRRMSDLPARADRADAQVERIDSPKGPYDLVLCDVPCSGSGAWRRAPEGKWRLTSEGLSSVCEVQADILDHAANLVGTGGTLAYVTCSVLNCENEDQIGKFLRRNTAWHCIRQQRFHPNEGGDGFFVSILTRGKNENTT
ncbi:RsmB/NOP family class I SAM-dependent RNA methyltransferase [Marivita sp. S2033]|uniref:RsmB/NOP family class I SAM-dependent RNA methyltransferase n=1 Tax=Marivita sp. S2033 TaxID=3373187 RepID=UPI0039821278